MQHAIGSVGCNKTIFLISSLDRIRTVRKRNKAKMPTAIRQMPMMAWHWFGLDRETH